MPYESILWSLGAHLHCAGMCLHPVRVHACNTLSNDFSLWLSLWVLGLGLHFAELSFFFTQTFILPLKHVTQKERSACWFTPQPGKWFRASAAKCVLYRCVQNPDVRSSLQWHLLYTQSKYLSQHLLGPEAEGMLKNAGLEEGQNHLLLLRKAKCWSRPWRVKREDNMKRKRVECINLTVFWAVQETLKSPLWKAALRISERSFNIHQGVSQQVKHLPILNTPARAPAFHTAALPHRDTGFSALLLLVKGGGTHLL